MRGKKTEINLGAWSGDASWNDWWFEKAGGNAKHWVLRGPVGGYVGVFLAGDVSDGYHATRDNDYLRRRCGELEDLLRGAPVHLTLAELAVMRSAAEILMRVLPEIRRARGAPSPVDLTGKQFESEHETLRVLTPIPY